MSRDVQVDRKEHSIPDKEYNVNKNPVWCIWRAAGALLSLDGGAPR